eukprot:262811-Ditylum_brightwellii.AAC.1
MAKADTGASLHYWTSKDDNVSENIQSINNGPRVTLSDSTTIQANKKGTTPLHPALFTKATTVHSFPHLTNAPLLSVGQQNSNDGLWNVPAPTLHPATNITTTTTKESLNIIIRKVHPQKLHRKQYIMVILYHSLEQKTLTS